MPARTLTYLVRRRLPTDGGRGHFPGPNDVYLAAFDDRASAEAHAAHLHRDAVLAGGPDLLFPGDETPLASGLAGATSRPESALRDFLLDGGVAPPDPVEPADPVPCRSPGTSDHWWDLEQRRWARWWGGLSRGRQQEERRRRADERGRQAWDRWWREVVAGGRLTADQRQRVCEAFDTLRLFEVVESSRVARPPTAGAVYAVVHTRWVYADTWDFDSHDVAGVFPSRKAADAELARRRRECDEDRDGGAPHADDLTVVELPLDPGDGR
ncbi:hypothetical protein [Urbifossiella limnaea]|uniref:Uncharacterized protein n=1 Tax=Urbifossiella limnaea TaxID=2528023 RepID=A0A517Y1U8_9BACT|nr:hypothetical protein [Urbifossiella limnaea]QDU23740.1 hypothetical protein ETAA1_57470 [Urbifossiella limnaea]